VLEPERQLSPGLLVLHRKCFSRNDIEPIPSSVLRAGVLRLSQIGAGQGFESLSPSGGSSVGRAATGFGQSPVTFSPATPTLIMASRADELRFSTYFAMPTGVGNRWCPRDIVVAPGAPTSPGSSLIEGAMT
jgi:hypothetical protein